MVGRLLLRGRIVGLIAGVLAFAFARLYGEPQVDRAIAFEDQMAQAAGETPEPEIVSRATQASIGLATGVLVYGAALGGLFSLVFAYAYGRPRAPGSWGSLAGRAVLGCDPETIGYRTELFFIMIAISIAAMVLAIGLARRLWTQHGPWNASILAGLAFLIVFAMAKYALPDINEVPEQFSATVLWQFRVVSFGIQAILWTVIGLGFGAVVEHELAGRSQVGSFARPAAP